MKKFKDYNDGIEQRKELKRVQTNTKMAIDRSAYIDNYMTQIDPLFDKADELLIALSKSQELLANYIIPDSGISDRTVISDLLGILDDRKLVILMRELTGDDR